VAQQVGRLGRHEHGSDVLAELSEIVGGRVIRAARLVLAALVDGDYPPPPVGELAQDGKEVLLAAGVTRNKEGGVQLTGTGLGNRLKRGECPSIARDDRSPHPGGQGEGGWRRHG
jgi:hypothetical protein